MESQLERTTAAAPVGPVIPGHGDPVPQRDAITQSRQNLEKAITSSVDGDPNGDTLTLVAILGVNRLSMINEIYGFDAGSAVLQSVLDRLLALDADHVQRFSETKFAIIFRESAGRNPLASAREAFEAVDGMIIATQAGPVLVQAAMGVCQAETARLKPEKVIGHALSACSIAGNKHGLRIQVHEDNTIIGEAKTENAMMATRIIEAIRNASLELAFQPVVHARSGEIAFHEALVRMNEGGGHITGAGGFVPLAERLGFIGLVDEFALGQAIEILRTCNSAVLSINVSNETVDNRDWLSRLARELGDRRSEAERLIVEITESRAAADLEETAKFIRLVKSLGCRVAIDDFGAGYTSFANLKSLPFDIIKIDGRFAANLAEDEKNAAFVKSLLALANAFGAETVVECVEDADSAVLLTGWGVKYLQGHCFGRARSAQPCPDYRVISGR